MDRLIFTDLDGTFLNHHNYSFAESKEALQKILLNKIPLIFTTSKTKAEVIELQKKAGIIEPFITENGAALFIPKGYRNFSLEELEEYNGYKVLVFGKQYSEIMKFYNHYKDQFGMLGFSDMSVEKVVELTGLEPEDAVLAKQRDFTEPFILEDSSKLEQLEKVAHKNGLKLLKGGRFFHLIGDTQDKGVAVQGTTALFERLSNSRLQTFGFGDSQNDIDMLKSVDQPINIQNYQGKYLTTEIENVKRSSFQGSAGFNEMVLAHVF